MSVSPDMEDRPLLANSPSPVMGVSEAVSDDSRLMENYLRSVPVTRHDLEVTLQAFAEHSLRAELDKLQQKLLEELRPIATAAAPQLPAHASGDAGGEASAPEKKGRRVSRNKLSLATAIGHVIEVEREKKENRKSFSDAHHFRRHHELTELEEALHTPSGTLDEQAKASDASHTKTTEVMLGGGADAQRVAALDAKHVSVGHLSTNSPLRRCRKVLRGYIKSAYFEYTTSLFIMANTAYTTIVTDHMARHELDEDRTPNEFTILEALFLTIFVLELALRIWAHGKFFFKTHTKGKRGRVKGNVDFNWNMLDFFTITLQVLEKLARQSIGMDDLVDISFLRILRLVRLIRIVRILKVFRYVRDLRMIVVSIWRSLSLFFWSAIAQAFMTAMWSLYFTEAVLNFKLSHPDIEFDGSDLNAYFGNVSRSALSLFEAVTGGRDWADLYDELSGLDPWFGSYPFLLYIAFTVLAILNIVNGLFLETAMDRAREERDLYLASNARAVFARADQGHTGLITWPNFQSALDHSDMVDFFEAIDIDISEAKELFDLLDMSGDGTIQADEFLNGCLRMHGPAKALDLLLCSRDINQMYEQIGEMHQTVQPARKDSIGAHSPTTNTSRQDAKQRAANKISGGSEPQEDKQREKGGAGGAFGLPLPSLSDVGNPLPSPSRKDNVFWSLLRKNPEAGVRSNSSTPLPESPAPQLEDNLPGAVLQP